MPKVNATIPKPLSSVETVGVDREHGATVLRHPPTQALRTEPFPQILHLQSLSPPVLRYTTLNQGQGSAQAVVDKVDDLSRAQRERIQGLVFCAFKVLGFGGLKFRAWGRYAAQQRVKEVESKD